MFTKHFNTRRTPQTEAIPGSSQVANSAGGFCFVVDDWTRLERFLILGSAGGTYYASERALTVENAQVIVELIKKDGVEVVRRLTDVSVAGRAPKNDQAVFVLALAAAFGDAQTRNGAYAALPLVCRTGTHLFQFAEFSNDLRGWGSGLRRAVASWYAGMDPAKLAYQVTKYQNRNGWSHRDLMRLCHPKFAADSDHQVLANWVVKGWPGVGQDAHPNDAMRPVWALEKARAATTEEEIIRLVRDFKLVRECVPTRWLSSPAVWEALLDHMPVGAVVRNLARMTAIGLLAPLSEGARKVREMLGGMEALRAARLHPLSILTALKTYASGHGVKGSLTWTPVHEVVDALDGAFYLSFGAVRPTGKRWMVAVDVSGSMVSNQIGSLSLSAREAAAAMALVTAAVEPRHYLTAFSGPPNIVGTEYLIREEHSHIAALPISPRMRLSEAIAVCAKTQAGNTDCSLPVLHALNEGLQVDAFLVLTDNETFAGKIHVSQALAEYRQRTGIPARLVVAGMTSSGFTVADFDLAAPAVISEFVGQEALKEAS